MGLIDPNTTKKIGQFLGIDALMIGTVTDMGGTLEVIGRLVHTETARILAVSSISFIKDGKIETLYRQGQAATGGQTAPVMSSRDLVQAAGTNNIDRAKALLGGGANINGRDEKGDTPLTNAAWLGSPNMVEFLVKQGADIAARTNSGNTPFLLGAARGNLYIINYLADNRADIRAVNHG